MRRSAVTLLAFCALASYVCSADPPGGTPHDTTLLPGPHFLSPAGSPWQGGHWKTVAPAPAAPATKKPRTGSRAPAMDNAQTSSRPPAMSSSYSKALLLPAFRASAHAGWLDWQDVARVPAPGPVNWDTSPATPAKPLFGDKVLRKPTPGPLRFEQRIPPVGSKPGKSPP